MTHMKERLQDTLVTYAGCATALMVVLLGLACVIAPIWVAIHFILKYW